MRFTRPGARPCHVPSLEATQLSGCVLGAGVDDERPRAKLRAGQVLELVPASVRWIKLDVEVMVDPASAGRLLVHRHHVRQWYIKQTVVLLQHALEDSRKGFAVLSIKVEQPIPMSQGSDVHLVRPTCKRWHKSDPVLIAEHG